MIAGRGLRRRLMSLFRARRLDEDLDAEIRDHLDRAAARHVEQGIGSDAARLAALRDFGGVAQTREVYRSVRGFAVVDALRQDVRYSIRTLRKSPGFACVATLTVALGIGAASTVFAVAYPIFLKALPYPESDHLVRIIENIPADENRSGTPSREHTIDPLLLPGLRARTRTLSDAGIYYAAVMTLSLPDEAVRLSGSIVSPSTLQMTGARPILGRAFQSEDEVAGRDNVVILAYQTWSRYFQADASIVGRLVILDGQPRVVVGVMSAGFSFPDPDDQFWIPCVTPAPGRSVYRAPMLARVRSTTSLDTAAAEVDTILRHLQPSKTTSTMAATARARFDLVPLQQELGEPVKPAISVLSGAVAVVLLIVWANVACLLLARGTGRQREFAVRLALGASRSRVARQLLTESLTLAFFGGALGLLVAAGGIPLVRFLASSLSRPDLTPGFGLPRLDDIRLTGTVMTFATLVSVASAFVFGLAPIGGGRRETVAAVLHDEADAGSGRFALLRRRRLQGLLIVMQIAMATALLTGGGLLLRSFANLLRVRPGYDSSHLLTFQVTVPRDRYTGAQLRSFGDDLIARLEAAPAVRGAAYAQALPMVQARRAVVFRRTPQLPAIGTSPDSLAALPNARLVSANYLQVMGIRLLRGRSFTDADQPGRPLVLLINEALARRDFPNEDPIGQTVYTVGAWAWQVVGIVDDVRQFGLDKEPEPQIFADLRQWPIGLTAPALDVPNYYAVRTTGEPEAIRPVVRGVVHQLDAHATLDNVATMDGLLTNSLSRSRLYAVLLTVFATIAVALAIIGLHGVLSYAISRRTREIGIRMALGATGANVMRTVFQESFTLAAAGVAIGLACAFATTKLAVGLLFGVGAHDAATFVFVPLLLAGVSTISVWAPAHRAARVDPMIALRAE